MYFGLGTVISFLINYFFLSSENIGLDIYYAVAFGSAWGLAYYLDTPNFSLPKKLGLSFVGMGILVLAGTLIFNLELAIPSILKFSTVFVAYYLFADHIADSCRCQYALSELRPAVISVFLSGSP